MADILDYIDWRGDLPLSVSPFNEVDNLLLAELSFLDFNGLVPPPGLGDGVVLHEAAAAYFARSTGREIDLGVLVPDRIPALLCAMAKSVRFGGMRLNAFEERVDAAREQQFAALTVETGDGAVYAAFRGTDDTLVGWKEDLNLGFLDEIPSQQEALRYLARVARQYGGARLRVGGHSKGGNLAVFAAVRSVAAVQDRIECVYNNDGPGFLSALSGTVEYRRIAPRILTLVPQSSVVGMLLEHEQRYQVVRSCETGLRQHDGFSWEVKGTEFVRMEELSREGKILDSILDSWTDSLASEQREAMADALFAVLSGTGAQTLSELNGEKLRSAVSMLKTYKNLDREARRVLSDALKLLMKLGAQSVVDDVRRNELASLHRKLEEKSRRLLGARERKTDGR